MGHAGEVRDVGIARGVDEFARAQGAASGLGLDEHGVDAAVAGVRHARRPGVEQQFDAGAGQQLVGGALVGRDVVAADADAALQPVLRHVEAAEGVDALQQFLGHAAHERLHHAVAAPVQAGEIGHAAGRAHAAEEAVALDQQRGGTVARRAHGGGDAGRPAADDDDIVFAVDRRAPRRLGDRVRRLHALDFTRS